MRLNAPESAFGSIAVIALACVVLLVLKNTSVINRLNDMDQFGVDSNGALRNDNPCTSAVVLPGGKHGYVNAREGAACAARNVTQYASNLAARVLAFDKHKDLLTASHESQYKFDLDLMNATQYNYVEGTELLSPSSMCWDATGRYMFIVDTENHLVFRHDHTTTATIHIAGVYDAGTGVGIPGDEVHVEDGQYPSTATYLNRPTDCAVGSDNKLYIADSGNGRIIRISDDMENVPDGTTWAFVFASDAGKGRQVPGMSQPYRLLYKDSAGLGGMSDVLFVTEYDNRMVYAIANTTLGNAHTPVGVYVVHGLLKNDFYHPFENVGTITGNLTLTSVGTGFYTQSSCRVHPDGTVDLEIAVKATGVFTTAPTIALPTGCQPLDNQHLTFGIVGTNKVCAAQIVSAYLPGAGAIKFSTSCDIIADEVLVYSTRSAYGTRPHYEGLFSDNVVDRVSTAYPDVAARTLPESTVGGAYARCDDISAVPGSARDIAVVCRSETGASWVDRFALTWAGHTHPLTTGTNVGLIAGTVTRIAGAGTGLGLGKAVYTAASITGITAQLTRAEALVVIDTTHVYVASDAYYNPLTGVASGLGLFKFNTLTQVSNMSYIGGAAKLAPPTSTIHYGGNRLKDMTLQIHTVRARPGIADTLYIALPFNNSIASIDTSDAEFPVSLTVGAFNYRNISLHSTEEIPVCKHPIASTYNATGDSHYLACYEGHVTRIYKITAMGTRTAFAHTGAGTKAQWGVTAANVYFGKVGGMIATSRGDLIVSDETTNRIVKIKIDGATTTTHVLVNLLGTQGTNTVAEGAVNATGALLNEPSGICMDSSGGVYIADASNHAVRYLNSTSTEAGAYLTVTTVVGLPGSAGRGSDNGVALLTKLNRPTRLLCGTDGRVWIADSGNSRLLVYNPTNNRTAVYGEYDTDTVNVIGSPVELTKFGDIGEMVQDPVTLTVYIAEGANGIRAITNTTGVCMTGVCMPCSGTQCPSQMDYEENHGHSTIKTGFGIYIGLWVGIILLAMIFYSVPCPKSFGGSFDNLRD